MCDQPFPGEAEKVAEFRAWVVQVLAGLPRGVVENAETVAGELGGNAVQHSASGLPGGKYLGRVDLLIEVVDQGPAPLGAEDRDEETDADEHGRGLLICSLLGELSCESTPEGGRRTAVRLPLTTAASPASEDVR